MKIRFIDKASMERSCRWFDTKSKIWEAVSMCGERLRVDSDTLEVLEAWGWEAFIGTLLIEGMLKIS